MISYRRSLEKLTRLVRTPADAQRLLYDIDYSRSETMKSALMVSRTASAHCLEAVHLVAYLLEQRDFPPLVLSLDSADDICHVVYAYEGPKGWGSVGRSKEAGLHGRAPCFRNIRELALSYFDPYVDDTGKLTGYALVDLDASQADWRFSLRNVWASEKHILRSPHKAVELAKKRFAFALRAYKDGGHKPRHFWR